MMNSDADNVGVMAADAEVLPIDETPGSLWWRFGDVSVTRVVERSVAVPLRQVLPMGDPSELAAEWLRPDYVDASDRLLMSMQLFLVEADGLRIVIDPGYGNDKERPLNPSGHRLQTAMPTDLVRAGFPPESVDLVVCTHLHVDHVGWNTTLRDGQWVPTFPNARYIFTAADNAYWSNLTPAGPPSLDHTQVQVYADSVRPVIAAGLAELVPMDHVISPNIRLVPTPGHTPGHAVVEVGSGDERARFLGDLLHHPVQLNHLDWGHADVDPDEALRSRLAIIEEAASQGTALIGAHWYGRSAGTVAGLAGGYRLRPVAPEVVDITSSPSGMSHDA
jgi:glyoxylase-like metal-dependent hydrolase (beta-lactamase superfamily II)